MGGEPLGNSDVENFVDDRGNGLRVSWHDDRRLVVLSIWRERECVGTVRLCGDDLMRLSTMVTQAWLASQGHVDLGT